METDLTAIDLENIEYGDVLQLHWGWRRAETALNEVTDELNALRTNHEHLQSIHQRFKDQIRSLESVRDFTISLQSQLNLSREENVHLAQRNAQVTKANSSLERRLEVIEESERTSQRLLHEARIESENVRARYHEVAVSHKELENMLSNEIAIKSSLENHLISSNNIVDTLRSENSSMRLKHESTLLRMSQCDQELSSAARQLSVLSEELDTANRSVDAKCTSNAESEVLKGDISRLLRLMEHYPASREFLDRWHDSDGMSFIGVDDRVEFDDFVEEESYFQNDITPREYVQLRRSYDTDQFPITANFNDESKLWIPRKACNIGLQFSLKNIPHIPPRLITELLRKLNKVWLTREHRICGDFRAFYDGRLSDLKRQLSHSKPYRGVIAENHIRRLKNQVREGRDKVLISKPRSIQMEANKGGYFSDFSEIKQKKNRSIPVRRSSEDIFVGDSNLSLETMGAYRQRERVRQQERNSHRSPSLSPYGDKEGIGNDIRDKVDRHPSELYLRGALWLGRNITMVIEDLAEALDFFRSRFLSEVTTASSDPDLKRARSHLSQLATTSIDEAVALTNRCRARGRDIIQGVGSISVGDIQSFQDLLGTLPIESGLHTPHRIQRDSRRSRSRSKSKITDLNPVRFDFASERRSNSNSRSRDRRIYRSPSRSQQ